MWNEIFDRIYVVSLPQSIERRAYVEAHLAVAGLAGYEWHDACWPDHPRVAALMNGGKVHEYPPCFRCGKRDCGRDDCNNVLTPQQIAVFATYLALWEKIADTPQRALILEDDIHLHTYTPKVLAALNSWLKDGSLLFEPKTPRLLRLGWALCDDHSDSHPVQLNTTLKMSNPCHALTSAFAQKALDRFETVCHTADVFLHSHVPDTGEAFTVSPPMASELSWSEGRFQSLIHPKDVHADFLEQQGCLKEARAARKLSRHHARYVAHRSQKEN